MGEFIIGEEHCPRERDDCTTYLCIISDDETTVVCSGCSTPESRRVAADRFRLCFVSETTDTIFDHDETDLKDMMAVIGTALAMVRDPNDQPEK